MFTGLVETVGTVTQVTGREENRVLTIKAGFAAELAIGESVAVNGVCLTVTEKTQDSFSVEAVKATLDATTTGLLRVSDSVNLERALALGDRLGGHLVQGHIDEVGKVRRVERHSGHWTIAVNVRRDNTRLLVAKGSVCVDGVSLTIADVRPGEFTVNIIPHTWENTTLKRLRSGALVNVEHDMIVKAVQKRAGAGSGSVP